MSECWLCHKPIPAEENFNPFTRTRYFPYVCGSVPKTKRELFDAVIWAPICGSCYRTLGVALSDLGKSNSGASMLQFHKFAEADAVASILMRNGYTVRCTPASAQQFCVFYSKGGRCE